MNSRATANFSTPQEPPGCLAPLVYLVLLIAGGAILYAFFLEPFKLAFESMKWEKTPCTIIKSQVAPAAGRESAPPLVPEKSKSEPPANADAWKADVTYRYSYNGEVHRSSQIWFLKHSPDTRANAQEIVNRYPVGRETHCYVDPRKASTAVLERGLKPQLLIALAPLLMALIGAAGLLSRAAMLLPHRKPVQAPSDFPAAYQPLRAPSGKKSVVRRPKSGLFPIIFFLLFSGFWNFVVSFLVREVISDWKHGIPGCHGLFLTLFAVPFVAVGIVTAVMPFYFILKLFNPRPVLTFSSDSVELGGNLDIAWAFEGNTSRISRLRIKLEGREEATYRRGTSTYTDREVFRTISLIDTTEEPQIASGTLRLAMPTQTMPSFSAGHNKIVWAIKFIGEIHRWPDVNEDFEVNVVGVGSNRP